MASSQVVVLNSSTSQHAQPPNIIRPLANFPPCIWGDRFTSFSADNQVRETYAKQNDELKEEVRRMLVSNSAVGKTSAETINLINTLERLGVSYHFDTQIEEVLDQMFHRVDSSIFDQDYDLYAVALHFRVFRQHGYNISCDIFNKFKDSNGKFKETLTSDPMGLLSLYEATHVRTHGEDILDEAFAFTTSQLESMLATSNLTPFVANQVAHALKQSLHQGIPRVEARYYISVYEDDPLKNELLLKFSKIDFNLLQLLHKEELCHLSRWWNGLKFEEKLPYARNRVAECYLWAVTMYFEPQYSLDRIIFAQTILMLSITDDTYDAYGTLDELKIFTDAVQRWDMSAIEELPEYMKIIYKVLLDLYVDIDQKISKEGKSAWGVNYSIEALKELVRCYYIEATWLHQKHVSTFDEYMRNALVTGTYFQLGITSFMNMGEVATVEAFEWAQKKPKILVASNTVGRLINDIVTHEEESKRGIAITGIECYMKEYGLPKEKVVKEFFKRIENAWKDINEECLMPTAVPMPLLIRCLNLTRITDVVYKIGDGYTYPEKILKSQVISLFIDSIPLS